MTTTNTRIVVADEEPLIRWSLAQRLRADGFDVLEAGSGEVALEHVLAGVDLVVLGDKLPDMHGFAMLRRIRELDADVLAILLTPNTSVETVIEGMKEGAFHVAHKPFDLDDVRFVVSRALETTQLRREVRRVHASLGHGYGVHAIVGPSAAMEMLRSFLTQVAISPAVSVLLMGEAGTGKDLVARVLHYASARANAPFLSIACSAFPDAVLDDELFGHGRAASIDARGPKRGLFELADGGTLFLDEVDAMSPRLQAKLLRALEDRSFQRVEGLHDIATNAFVIAATSHNLDDEVRTGRFRRELFCRLNVLPILLPPLRQRVEDIPALVDFYIGLFNREFRKNVKGVSPAALQALRAYRWAGNVRELRNSVERALLLASADWLQVSDFPAVIHADASPVDGDFQLPAHGVNLDDLERSFVTQALARCGGNQTRAAGLLGMNRDQIRYRVEKYGLPRLQHV